MSTAADLLDHLKASITLYVVPLAALYEVYRGKVSEARSRRVRLNRA